MAHRYLHSEKPFSSYVYTLSEEYNNFRNNLSKMGLLLATSEKCKHNTINFEENEKELYSDLKKQYMLVAQLCNLKK